MKAEADISQWLNSIIEYSFDGLYITDGDANTLMVNQAYVNITGLKREEVIGRNMRDLVGEQVISASGSLRVLETGQPVTIHQEFKTGKKALITSSPIRDHAGRIVLIVTNVRDLTEIYRLKENMREREKQNKLLQQELQHLKEELLNFDLVIEDFQTVSALRLADRVRGLDTSVILLGETGVGKEVFAKYIFQYSTRCKQPFVKVNCGAIPEALMESELFGYEKGAFTDADKRGKAGLFEVANKGTIFLDEVGELPLPMQVKLLRALQDKEITRVGGTKPIQVDVRLIAATNRDLEKMVQEKLFREDLYYRLMVFPIRIPPLRQRPRDILPLIRKFTEELNRKYGWNKQFSASALRAMENYRWPGNVRELRNVVEQAMIISSESEIRPESLSIRRVEGKTAAQRLQQISNLPAYLEELERQYIEEAYARYGNVRDAAKSLGISPSTLVRKRKKDMRI